jgi:hypothetical protein
MPMNYITRLYHALNTTILPNNSCNRYCNNTSEESLSEHKFQCGSLNDTRIRAVYDLNGTCPADSVYIKELKKCMSSYRSFWSSCTPPSKTFVYDKSITWSIFLKTIDTLQLNASIVSVDFDEDITVNSSWKCPSNISSTVGTYYSYSHLTYSGYSSNIRYILDEGCLRESSYSSYAHRYSHRLCMTNPLNKYSTSDDDDDDEKNSTYISSTDPQIKFCPPDWFDLNERCYRMSDERKTIQDARQSCISISTESSKNDKSQSWLYYDNDEDEDSQLTIAPKGDIVQYTSQWQTRLGFFLLDTISENGKSQSATEKEDLRRDMHRSK